MKIQFTYTKFIFLIAIFLVVIVGIIIWSLLSTSPANEKPLPAAPTPISIFPTRPKNFPTSAPSPTFTQIPVNEKIKERLISQMPRNTPTYDIEYLKKSDTFIITIKKSPYDVNKTLAERWITANGVGNLKSLNILYNKRLLVE